MKLITFDAETNTVTDNGSKVTFGKKGVITINAIGAKLMGVAGGGKLAISQNEEDPGQWYIHKSETGFQFKPSTSDQLKGSSAFVKRQICECFSWEEDQTLKFMLGDQPVKHKQMLLWPLFSLDSDEE